MLGELYPKAKYYFEVLEYLLYNTTRYIISHSNLHFYFS